jgi:hypothetical protein
MAKKSVRVVFENDEFKVVPPKVKLKFNKRDKIGDQLTLENRAGEELVWILQDPRPFGQEVLEIVKNGKDSPERTARDAPGEYPYQVLMISSGKKAKGNSDPVIIIEN